MIHKYLRLLSLPILLCCFVHAQGFKEVQYAISLRDAAHHLVRVRVLAEATGSETDFQLPVWNALYQVRDFAKNVIQLKAQEASGRALPIKKLDKTTWRVSAVAPDKQIQISYEIVADQAGPFSAQLNQEHAFFNLAQILVYPIGQKDRPVTVRFTDIPAGWKLATPLTPASNSNTSDPATALQAPNYDRLVDSPCELGSFQEFSFEQSGAAYRVVIDGNPKNYKSGELIASLRKITATETEWMNDRPFDHYLFIYHFPDGPAGGGMEHAYSTAIGISAANLRDLTGFSSVSAHEFFHLWNVKRIRPQSLEPVDYSRENYTRALWFSEGVTNTVAELTLVKARLLDEKRYLERLSSAITILQNRPAHRTQSAEESSLDTWFDGYPSYRLPERSINYYNKGEILGVLLDLKMREDSHGRKSLRDLFQSMNQKYAMQNRFFRDSEDVRAAAEALTGTDLHEFFDSYVAGTDELPYDQLFASAGLKLTRETRIVADPGFVALRNFDGPLLIADVTGKNAVAAGLRAGDELVQLDGKAPGQDFAAQISERTAGSTIRLRLRRGNSLIPARLALEGKDTAIYRLVDQPDATPQQRARRAAWLASEDELNAGTSDQ